MRFSLILALSLSTFLFAGCAGMPIANPSNRTAAASGAAIHGIVHGGQSPIQGAAVYLLAANTTGYGGAGIAASSSNASISLLNSNVLSQTPAGGEDGSGNYYVTTGAKGAWGITGDYTCPSCPYHRAAPLYWRQTNHPACLMSRPEIDGKQ